MELTDSYWTIRRNGIAMVAWRL